MGARQSKFLNSVENLSERMSEIGCGPKSQRFKAPNLSSMGELALGT